MFVGIDLGSSSVKVIAIDASHVIKASATYADGTSAFEHDANMVSQSVRHALTSLFQKGIDPFSIEGIGLCGHGPSIIFVDDLINAHTPIITWQDKRAYPQARFLQSKLPNFLKDGTSYEAKLLWFYQNYPELFHTKQRALYPKDYLIALLCGEVIMDSSTASTIAFYKDGNWNAADSFFPKSVMPRVVPSWECVGHTSTEFAALCGFVPGTPIYPGGIDAFCEAVGAGGFAQGSAIDGSGTSTCLTRSIRSDEQLKGAMLSPSSLPEHVLPRAKLLIHMLSCTGLSYRWLSSLFSRKELDALQDELQPSNPVNMIYLPYLSGERFPIFDDKATGAFLGLRPDTGKKELLQALFQGVALAIDQNLSLMGEGIQKVRAVGGANQSDAWLQIKANVTGLPYQKMAETDASAQGAALIAALGSGYELHKLEGLIKVERTFAPDPEAVARYAPLKPIYQSLYSNLKDSFHNLFDLSVE